MMKFFKSGTILAMALLFFMGFVAINSVKNDSITTDEAPHITAGYSYLRFQDYRLNPEHPPLIKDIAAFPLLFMDLNFPLQSPAWTEMVNAQWDLAPEFLYKSGNNPDEIIFWARLGPILLTLLFGWFVFKWARELYGPKWGLFCLALFAFSSTIMAHGRLVTTDVAAAFAFFAAIYFYVRYLKAPSKKNFLFAGLIFGIAQLLKFSLVLLFAFLPLITLLWILANHGTLNLFRKPVLKDILLWKWRFAKIMAISFVLIIAVYQLHVLNYPAEKQIADISHILNEDRLSFLKNILIWMADKPVLRAFGQYILGVSMVFVRVQGGNTTYFLGEVSNRAWMSYFPIVFLLKVPTAILALLGLSAAIAARNAVSLIKQKPAAADFMRRNFAEMVFALFIVFYWTISVTGNLNIGVRHILPSFPFMYLIIAGQLKRWQDSAKSPRAASPPQLLKQLMISAFSETGKIVTIVFLLMLNIASFADIYPYYLAHFNIIAGGPENGYKYVVDSNLDWGQDLRRLAEFVEKQNIKEIKVDYFGGGDVSYYLGDKAILWHADNGPTTGWIAVSATYYQTSRAYPAASYAWLAEYEPVKKIGYSIFVYDIESWN